MAVSIVQDFIPKRQKNRPGYAMSPLYLTIHSTANTSKGAGAKAHAAYVKTGAAVTIPASWHFTVDDKIVYQHLPLTENGWHAGDGTNGVGNRKSIGIEICENSDGNQAKAIENAAWLCAKLIKEVKSLTAFPGCMKQHADWANKNCPRILRTGNKWALFLTQVKAYLTPTADPKPDLKLPQIIKSVGIRLDHKDTGVPGFYSSIGTLGVVHDVLEKLGIEVTPHGSYINIVPPPKVDTKEIERLRADVKRLETVISDVRRVLG